MSNQISGRVIAVSPVQTVAASDPSKQPLKKRMVYLDCTRYDPYTGERSQYENKPLMEFSGDKVLEKVNPKLDAIKAGDVVTISFDIQGMDYQDKATGKKKNFTGIRCYDVELRRSADANGQQAAPAAAPASQQQVQQVAQKLNAAPVPQEPAPAAQSPFVGEEKKDNDLPF